MGSDFEGWKFRKSFEGNWKWWKLGKFNNKGGPWVLILLNNIQVQTATGNKSNLACEGI